MEMVANMEPEGEDQGDDPISVQDLMERIQTGDLDESEMQDILTILENDQAEQDGGCENIEGEEGADEEDIKDLMTRIQSGDLDEQEISDIMEILDNGATGEDPDDEPPADIAPDEWESEDDEGDDFGDEYEDDEE
jgi:hypothetical protein